MQAMRRSLVHAGSWSLVALALGAFGCGGSSSSSGGSGGGGTSASDGTITASQSWASSAVSAVNGGVANVAQESGASGTPITLLKSASAHALSLDPLVAESGSIDCDVSGSFSYSFTLSGSNISGATFTYSSCVESTGEAPISGTLTITFTSFTDANDWTATYSVDLTSSPAGAVSGNATCTDASGTVSCSWSFGGYTVSGTVTVSTSGSTTTVGSATVTTTLSSKNITIVYSNWVYDASAGYATSGTATITDTTNGNNAVITAEGGGSYKVVITINGQSATFTVTVS